MVGEADIPRGERRGLPVDDELMSEVDSRMQQMYEKANIGRPRASWIHVIPRKYQHIIMDKLVGKNYPPFSKIYSREAFTEDMLKAWAKNRALFEILVEQAGLTPIDEFDKEDEGMLMVLTSSSSLFIASGPDNEDMRQFTYSRIRNRPGVWDDRLGEPFRGHLTRNVRKEHTVRLVTDEEEERGTSTVFEMYTGKMTTEELMDMQRVVNRGFREIQTKTFRGIETKSED